MKPSVKVYFGRGYEVRCVLVYTPKSPNFMPNPVNPKNEFGQIIFQLIGTLAEAVKMAKEWRKEHPDTETEYYKDFQISTELSVVKEYSLKI